MGAATISLIFIRRLFVTEDFPRPVTTPSARHAHTSTALHHKNKREREKEDFIIDPYIPNRPYTHTQSVYRRRRNWCFVVVTAHRFFFLSGAHTTRDSYNIPPKWADMFSLESDKCVLCKLNTPQQQQQPLSVPRGLIHKSFPPSLSHGLAPTGVWYSCCLMMVMMIPRTYNKLLDLFCGPR